MSSSRKTTMGLCVFFAVAAGCETASTPPPLQPASVAATSTLKASPATSLIPGLVGEVFDMGDGLADFPTIPADKQPTVKKVDKQVNVNSTGENWPGTNLAVHYYVRWTGVVRIPKDGKYKFYSESDDGSRLFVDDKPLVDNGGLHAMQEKDSAEVELKAGDHPIKIEFFQNEGEAGCKVSWSGEGLDKTVIPETALFHR
jgi:hypothetical protein